MNTLSWLIYAGEVAGNMQGFIGFGGSLAVAAGAVMTLAGNIPWQHYSWDSQEKWTQKEAFRGKLARNGPRFLVAGALCILVAALTPASRTIYMIAASEIGEQIVTSPDAIEMMGDLKAIIKKRLKDELGE